MNRNQQPRELPPTVAESSRNKRKKKDGNQRSEDVESYVGDKPMVEVLAYIEGKSGLKKNKQKPTKGLKARNKVKHPQQPGPSHASDMNKSNNSSHQNTQQDTSEVYYPTPSDTACSGLHVFMTHPQQPGPAHASDLNQSNNSSHQNTQQDTSEVYHPTPSDTACSGLHMSVTHPQQPGPAHVSDMNQSNNSSHQNTQQDTSDVYHPTPSDTACSGLHVSGRGRGKFQNANPTGRNPGLSMDRAHVRASDSNSSLQYQNTEQYTRLDSKHIPSGIYVSETIEGSTLFQPTKESSNHDRLCHMLRDICPYLLRDFLKQYISLKEFPGVIYDSPMELLEDFRGSYDPFDLSLLCNLLTHINCGIDERDIKLIRNLQTYKNKYVSHAPNGLLDDKSFSNNCAAIKRIVKELEAKLKKKSVPSYADEIEWLKTASMDPEMEKKYILALENQRTLNAAGTSFDLVSGGYANVHPPVMNSKDKELRISKLESQLTERNAERDQLKSAALDREGMVFNLQSQLTKVTEQRDQLTSAALDREGMISNLQSQLTKMTEERDQLTSAALDHSERNIQNLLPVNGEEVPLLIRTQMRNEQNLQQLKK